MLNFLCLPREPSKHQRQTLVPGVLDPRIQFFERETLSNDAVASVRENEPRQSSGTPSGTGPFGISLKGDDRKGQGRLLFPSLEVFARHRARMDYDHDYALIF